MKNSPAGNKDHTCQPQGLHASPITSSGYEFEFGNFYFHVNHIPNIICIGSAVLKLQLLL